MKLLFDLSATQPSPDSKFHGGSDYSSYIFFEALKRGYKFEVCYNKLIPLHDDVNQAIVKFNIPVITFENSIELKQKILNSNYDRFFSGLPYLFDDFDFENTKFFMSILGLRTLEMLSFKEQLPYQKSFSLKCKNLIYEYFFKKRISKNIKKSYFKLLNIKNKHLFTISNHSLYSIINFFPHLQKENITLCHAPLNLSILNMSSEINEPYFLLVSGNRWIKNNFRAIKALDELFSTGQISNMKVVVLGCQGVNFKNKINNIMQFEFKDYVDKSELECYFQNAYAFIYPTLNEGFGYPPVKSMNYGVPVLASAISSVPEICTNAALYFNPFSISEIKNRILYLYNDIGLRKKLIKNGHDRVSELKLTQNHMIDEMFEILFANEDN